jgi:hypothetical protein
MNNMTLVIRECERAGLQFVRGRKHGKLVDPRTGRCVSVSSTPSCPNAHRAVLRDVRKYLGLLVLL